MTSTDTSEQIPASGADLKSSANKSGSWYRGLEKKIVVRILRLGLGAIVLGCLIELFVALMQLYTSNVGGSDFAVYLEAARHLAAGQSPYSPQLLAGPFPAQAINAYLYPPTFAWLLTPLLILPATLMTGLWICLQLWAIGAALWIAALAAGAKKRWRLAFMLLPAGIFYLPTVQSLYLGQLGTFIALGMALLLRSASVNSRGDRSAGPIATALGVLKITPGLVLIPLLAARPSRWKEVVLTALILIVPFVALNPGAWGDFWQVPLNLARGNAWYPDNLAPGTVFVYQYPGLAAWGGLFGLLAIGLSFGLLALSCLLARRPGGLPVALMAATGATILPFGSIWFHYLVILLPGLIYTGLRTGKKGRTGIILGYVGLMAFHIINPVVATLSMIWLVILPVILLWPSANHQHLVLDA